MTAREVEHKTMGYDKESVFDSASFGMVTPEYLDTRKASMPWTRLCLSKELSLFDPEHRE